MFTVPGCRRERGRGNFKRFRKGEAQRGGPPSRGQRLPRQDAPGPGKIFASRPPPARHAYHGATSLAWGWRGTDAGTALAGETAGSANAAAVDSRTTSSTGNVTTLH